MPPADAKKTNDRKAVFARATGRVQGVWFRAWTKEQADRLGVRGWVRNLKDGSVEAMFVGPEQSVDEILEALEGGPPLAKVDRVQTQPATGVIPGGFDVLRMPREDDAPDAPFSPSI